MRFLFTEIVEILLVVGLCSFIIFGVIIPIFSPYLKRLLVALKPKPKPISSSELDKIQEIIEEQSKFLDDELKKSKEQDQIILNRMLANKNTQKEGEVK